MTATRYKKEEMEKFNIEIGKYLGFRVLKQLNAGHSQLVKRLNKGYAQQQVKEQDKVDKKEREKTGEDTTVVEDVVVFGVVSQKRNV